jgi:GAF domain-containing protein/multidrug resistance efflux pump
MSEPDRPPAALEALGEEHLRRLLYLSHELNSTIDFALLLPRVAELVMGTLEADAGSLWLIEEGTLRCAMARGATERVLTGVEVPLGAGIVGDAVLRREPVRVPEAAGDPRFLHQVDDAAGFRTGSVLAVPLVTHGEVVGGIEVARGQERPPFTADDLLFLEALGDDAAAAIRNARLLLAERQARDLEALLEVGREITASLDLERILVSVVNLAGRAVPFERCVLALWRDGALRVRAISGQERVDRRAAAVRELERLLRWAAERGGEVFAADLDEPDDEVAKEVRARFPAWREESGARGFLLVPVRDGEGDLGVLHFEFTTPDALTDWGRKAATLLAQQAALALRNAQLYADVPFISWLEPLAERRRALAAVPGAVWLRYGALAAAVVLGMALVRVPLRLAPSDAAVRAVVQQPVRAAVGGILEEVWIREGQGVEAGEPVARVRDEGLLSRLREADAGLELARGEALAADARGDAAAAAAARVRTAELADVLTLHRAELERSRVLAPAPGLVLTPRVEELVGSFVAAGQPVAWLGDPGRMELELRMRQEDVGAVRVGDRVRARVSAFPASVFEGRVTAVAPRADAAGGAPAFVVRAVLADETQRLRPGMQARARVLTEPVPLAEFLFRRPWRWLRMTFWW